MFTTETCLGQRRTTGSFLLSLYYVPGSLTPCLAFTQVPSHPSLWLVVLFFQCSCSRNYKGGNVLLLCNHLVSELPLLLEYGMWLIWKVLNVCNGTSITLQEHTVTMRRFRCTNALSVLLKGWVKIHAFNQQFPVNLSLIVKGSRFKYYLLILIRMFKNLLSSFAHIFCTFM